MTSLSHKIDFAVIFSVDHANPNGDPLNGNRPRETREGFGEVSDVCIKRKIRNRLQDMGEPIFVQMEERCADGYASLSERAAKNPALRNAQKDKVAYANAACAAWLDVRAFGQVFGFKSDTAKRGEGVSIGVRGPVSLHPAFSVAPVEIELVQITKSVNGAPSETKASDTMGSKQRVEFGLYSFCGSINCQLAEKTGFTDADAEKILAALKTLFENDASAARPEGSMEVCRVYWWKHNCRSGQYSSARVHRSLKIEPKKLPCGSAPKSFHDFEVSVEPLPDLAVETYELI